MFWERIFPVVGKGGGSCKIPTNGTNTLTKQLAIHYGSPSLSILVEATGYVKMQCGFVQSSDEILKQILKSLKMH